MKKQLLFQEVTKEHATNCYKSSFMSQKSHLKTKLYWDQQTNTLNIVSITRLLIILNRQVSMEVTDTYYVDSFYNDGSTIDIRKLE